jgi:ArsR family transcriptional regulator
MKQQLEQYVQLLRSAAEPTRLRILALLAPVELSVSDIAAVLGQSQPRVSRHLKVLCDAGLLLRSREQHWIYYRLADTGPAAEFVRSVLDALDPTDPALSLDLERGGALRARRGGESEAATSPTAARDREQASGELGTVLGTELGDSPVDTLLYSGHAPLAVVPALSGRAHHTVALFTSREDLGRARTRLEASGPGRAELRVGDPRSLPFPTSSFDAVIIDRVDDPDLAALREAARVLRPAGRLIVIDDYDRLEDREAGANPLTASRERLARAGLNCTRLRPLDLDDARLLLAVAAPGAQREAAA